MLSTEEVLACVPPELRTGTQVVYNPHDDDYDVYYLVDRTDTAPQAQVKRILIGKVQHGQWVVSRLGVRLMAKEAEAAAYDRAVAERTAATWQGALAREREQIEQLRAELAALQVLLAQRQG